MCAPKWATAFFVRTPRAALRASIKALRTSRPISRRVVRGPIARPAQECATSPPGSPGRSIGGAAQIPARCSLMG
eukprot:9471654-Pyramimonas_sp.AAC.1